MSLYFTRRQIFGGTLIGGLLSAREAYSQMPQPVAAVPVKEYPGRSVVALTQGEDRRKNVYNALLSIDELIRPKLRTKKRVLIKPNDVSAVNQLSSTHAMALLGVLDYIAPRFKGPITIAESSFMATREAFQTFEYSRVVKEYASRQIELVDLNEEGKYVKIPVLNSQLHVTPARLAARFFDPEAFILGVTPMKAHNFLVVTLSVKNMVMGAPLRNSSKESRWSDKMLYHAGPHIGHYNLLVTAQALVPYWGATVIDGWEGMEGDGPHSGTPVPSRVAIASTDFIAADRVAVECMSIDPRFVGYLQYCGQVGIGNYDLSKIDVRGPAIASVQKKYRLHNDVERQLRWMLPGKVVVGEE